MWRVAHRSSRFYMTGTWRYGTHGWRNGDPEKRHREFGSLDVAAKTCGLSCQELLTPGLHRPYLEQMPTLTPLAPPQLIGQYVIHAWAEWYQETSVDGVSEMTLFVLVAIFWCRRGKKSVRGCARYTNVHDGLRPSMRYRRQMMTALICDTKPSFEKGILIPVRPNPPTNPQTTPPTGPFSGPPVTFPEAHESQGRQVACSRLPSSFASASRASS